MVIPFEEEIKVALSVLLYPAALYQYDGKESTFLVFYVWSNRVGNYADNEPTSETPRATVTVFANKRSSNVVNEVKTALRNAGLRVVDDSGTLDYETGRIQHNIEIVSTRFI